MVRCSTSRLIHALADETGTVLKCGRLCAANFEKLQVPFPHVQEVLLAMLESRSRVFRARQSGRGPSWRSAFGGLLHRSLRGRCNWRGAKEAVASCQLKSRSNEGVS